MKMNDEGWAGGISQWSLPVFPAAVFMLFLSFVSAAWSDETAVDLELLLAVDISHSMDTEEQALQRDGYVAAFRHSDVINAILAGRYKRVAVGYVEWAGVGRAFLTVPWMLIESEETANAFADRLAAQPIHSASRTSISNGLEFASRQFDGNGYRGLRRVIDISGDGPNNMGGPVVDIRDALVARGFVINGLPLILHPSYLAGFADQSELSDYYRDCVIGGIGSFLITVEKRSELVDAIRRKLVLEMSALEASPRLIPASAANRPHVDCLLGEKLHQDAP